MALVMVLLVLVELLLHREDGVDLFQLHAQMKHLPQVHVGDRTFTVTL